MTSKNSFFKILKQALSGRLWGIALSCLAFFFAHPVYAALCAGTIRDRIARKIFAADSGCGLFARDALGEGNAMIIIAVVIIAIFTAFNGFSYLYSKSKVDLFHSVPVKRDVLFVAEYVAGVITYIIPYVFFMILAIAVGGVNGLLSARGIGSAMIMLFLSLLGFLGIYNIAIIAIILTGNLGVGLLGTAVMMIYGPVLNLVMTAYKSYFLTYSNYSESEILATYGSPVTAYVNLTDGMGSFLGNRNLSAVNIILYILFVVISFAVGMVLFRIRQSEAAGKSMAFKKTMPVISILLLIVASLVGGITFENISKIGYRISYGWFAFGFLAALIIGHFIIQAIYYQDFKSLNKNLINILISGAISGVIAVTFMFDLAGYDKYQPKDEAYESAAIVSYAMQQDIEYFDFDMQTNEYGDRNVSVDLMNYRLKNIKITDKELVRDITTKAISDTKIFREQSVDIDTLSEKEREGYYREQNKYASVIVKYNMKNGGEKYRAYMLNLADNMDLYNRLYTNEDYKKVACPMMGLNPNSVNDIRFRGMFADEKIKLTDADMVALVKAYQADVAEQDVYSLKNEVPFGFLYEKVSIKMSDYTMECNTNKAYVYPSFKRTVAILDKYNVNLNYYRELSNIAYIEVSNYEVLDEDGVCLNKRYTDTEDIKNILENIYPTNMMDNDSVLMDREPVDIMVYYKEAPALNVSAMPYQCMKGMLPQNVAADMQLK